MQNNGFFFPKDIYKKHLSIINGVKFTLREIDVISCLINGRNTKRMSSLLSISPSTVFTHTNNIKLKIGCNSRESIMDFMEQSSAFPLIKKHYGHLVIYTAFEKVLNTVAQIKRGASQNHLLLYGEDLQSKEVLITQLEKHLNQAGLDVSIEDLTNNEEMVIETLRNDPQALIVFLQKGDREKLQKSFSVFDFLEVAEYENYYFFVLEILKKFLNPANINSYLQDFHDKYVGIINASRNAVLLPQGLNSKKNAFYGKAQSLRNKGLYFVFSISCFVLVCYIFQTNKGNKKMFITQSQSNHNEIVIRSDLPVPIPSILLNRPEEISQIDASLRDAEGIQTIALIGPGGAGKTILSRQYAQQQKANVIWELNAETSETLKVSFGNLAQALAQTEQDQKALLSLQDIKDPQEKEKKLLEYVKQRLRLYAKWFLIFDNVEDFHPIQSYFPQDKATWGQGKIIMTTRNGNIQNNKYVKDIIHIKELDPDQKLALFMKIITQGNLNPWTKIQEKEITEFLEKLPGYPLDIAVAAYYIKSTNTPYATYLEHLLQNHKNFTNTQENLLKTMGDYTKTRYGIIALSLQRLIEKHKDFGELMLLMSLLNSQNIPRELLSGYKGTLMVDSLISNLKQYSLMTDMFSASSHKGLSLHRSVQTISLAYLIEALNLKKDRLLLQSTAQSLENYVLNAIDKEDLAEMQLLASHCEAFLSHEPLLTPTLKGSIGSKLGGIYFYLSNYEKAKTVTEKSLSYLKRSAFDASSFAWAIASLGNTYKELGKHEKARELLEESLALYKKNAPEDHKGLAQALTYLGNIYKLMGNQEQAKGFLEQALTIYKKDLSEHSLGAARGLAYLGNVYKNMGDYLKAQKYLEESLALYKAHFPPHHVGIGRVLEYLGLTYSDNGEYEKAKTTLEQSMYIYKLYFPEDHVRVIWILANLANVYIEQSNYPKAKELLEKSLNVFKKNFQENHFRVAWVLAHLGDTYRRMGEHERAASLLEQSLSMYKTSFPDGHADVTWTLNCLRRVKQELEKKGL